MATYEKAFTMDDLKKQVTNYQNFAVKESAVAPKDVFTSAVFSKDVIQQLLNTSDDTHGLRIYMAKSSEDDTHDDVSYLLMPVAKEADGSFTDQVSDDHDHVASGLIALADCIGPLCKGGSLAPGNPVA